MLSMRVFESTVPHCGVWLTGARADGELLARLGRDGAALYAWLPAAEVAARIFAAAPPARFCACGRSAVFVVAVRAADGTRLDESAWCARCADGPAFHEGMYVLDLDPWRADIIDDATEGAA